MAQSRRTSPPLVPSPDGPAGRVVDAARALFFADGFEGATTDRLARDAGVSKSTIYKYFGDMSGVLVAVVRRESETFRLDELTPARDAAGFEAALVAFGANLLRFLGRPEIVRLMRLLHEQARHHPEIARVFFEATHRRTLEALETYLAAGRRAGLVELSDPPAFVAEQLMGLWNGTGQARVMLGVTDEPYPDARRRARSGVRMVLGC